MPPAPFAAFFALVLTSLPSFASTILANNLVPEGHFESALDTHGVPTGWVIDPPGWKNSPHLSFNVLVESDADTAGSGPNHFVRLGNTAVVPDEEGIFRLALVKALPQPAPARVNLSWRVRAAIEATSRVHSGSGVKLTIRFLDDKGRLLLEDENLFRLIRSTQGRWLERETVAEVPAGTAEIELLPGLYLVRGSVDIDDIAVSAVAD